MPTLFKFRRTRFLALSIYALLCAGNVAAGDALDPKVDAYFKTYCFACHSENTKKSDFRLDKLSAKVGFEDTPQWREVIERITSGEMPPKSQKNRPTAADSARVVEWMSARMKEGESARMAARGRVSYNRLTREEYVNTVRDLIGVHYDAGDPGGFLEDPEWRGFERLGSVLTLSPSNIEKYLAAGETILAEAYPAPSKKPTFVDYTKRAVLETQIDVTHRERLRELGLLDKVRFEMWPGDIFRYTASENLPEAGIYEISYTLSGLKPEKGRAPHLFVYETRLDRVLHEQDVVAPEDKPITITFRAHLPKGRPSIFAINEVPGPSNNPRSGRHGRMPFISIKDRRIPWQMKLTDEQGRARYPFLILDSVSMRGPIITEEEQRNRNAYFPTKEGDSEQLREGFKKLACNAFRRPVTPEELDKYIGIVKSELAAGEKFRDAVKTGMLAILCSKSFIFIAEGDENKERRTLNDWEIASRLSYLLWSTMPDEAALQAGRARKAARQGGTGEASGPHVGRSALGTFLRLVRLAVAAIAKSGRFPPDKKLYPDYDAQLEQSMVRETKAFFREVLNNGLTLREFIHSDWSMMNARLAQFYGLSEAGIARDEFQRVSLPADSRRGGLLTQAAILSLTSDGTRHRPVHRGVWLSEAIFGKTPPPPPGQCRSDRATNPIDAPKATLRMKLEAHIHDARCASCHAKIDPLGLAFENYDAIGRWRTEEVVEGTGKNPTVNPAGKLPDGRAYKTPEEFKQLLLADIDTFNAAFIEKLATYGLRRTLSFDDRNDLAAIAKASRDEGLPPARHRRGVRAVRFVSETMIAAACASP